MFKNAKIMTMLTVLMALSVVIVLSLTVSNLIDLKDNLLDDRTAAVGQIVETANSIANYYYKESQAGRLTEDEAKTAPKIPSVPCVLTKTTICLFTTQRASP